MRHILLRGAFWSGVYLVLVLTPLFIMLLRPTPAGLGFWRDFSVALGFASTTMMAVMFVLTARFKRATAPFGIDIIYYFHRQIALVTLIFILAHPVILLVTDPDLVQLLFSSSMPWSLRTGLGAMIAFLVLLSSSLWRKPLGIHYDTWRLWHAVLAPLALLTAVLHLRAVGYYLDTPWKGFLWAVIIATVIAILLYVRLVKPALLLTQPYHVVDLTEEVEGTWTVSLRPLGTPKLRFRPGQFAWLTIWHSPFALKEHPFSFSSSANRPEMVTFTIKALGDFTARIKELVPGEKVYLDGPYGAFSIDRHPAPGFVFLAGGIGCAPLMSMLQTLADRGDRRPVQFFYAGGSWQRLAFTEQLRGLQKKLDLELVYVLENPPPDWQGETGLITADLLSRRLPADRTAREYFVCGPVPMMHMVEKGLHGAGVPLTRLHSELFDLV